MVEADFDTWDDVNYPASQSIPVVPYLFVGAVDERVGIRGDYRN